MLVINQWTHQWQLHDDDQTTENRQVRKQSTQSDRYMDRPSNKSTYAPVSVYEYEYEYAHAYVNDMYVCVHVCVCMIKLPCLQRAPSRLAYRLAHA